jgi:hypothetical protein
MTEREWLECTNPTSMLNFLRGKASPRKLRLFACRCVECVLHLLPIASGRRAVEVAERAAEGIATPEEIQGAATAAEAAVAMACITNYYSMGAALACLHPIPFEAANMALDLVLDFGAEAFGFSGETGYATILRDLFGPMPFRPLTVDPCWAKANVVSLAQVAYDQQVFDHLPILADALEDAGCTDSDILSHLRGPGPHVRGCFVVDIILSKDL